MPADPASPVMETWIALAGDSESGTASGRAIPVPRGCVRARAHACARVLPRARAEDASAARPRTGAGAARVRSRSRGRAASLHAGWCHLVVGASARRRAWRRTATIKDLDGGVVRRRPPGADMAALWRKRRRRRRRERRRRRRRWLQQRRPCGCSAVIPPRLCRLPAWARLGLALGGSDLAPRSRESSRPSRLESLQSADTRRDSRLCPGSPSPSPGNPAGQADWGHADRPSRLESRG
jgi:hypothetical protein